MLETTVVAFGESREVVKEEDPSGKIVRLHPKGTRAFLDLSFNGSKPVRVHIPKDQYEKVILPQLKAHSPPGDSFWQQYLEG